MTPIPLASLTMASYVLSLSMSRYMNISMRMSFKVNPSECRKINANMISSVDECEY